MRNVALGGVLAAVLAGCGGQTKPITVITALQPLGAAPRTIAAADSPAPVRMIVPQRVVASVAKSVLPVYCARTNARDDFTGTGFMVAGGFATASHVVAACPAGVMIPFGPATDPDRTFSETASIDDRAHDLALVTYEPLVSSRQPLRLESAPAHVGEPLALIGVPSLSGLSSFQSRPEVVPGNVVATNWTVQLTSSNGGRETLTDAIEVAAAGLVSGESGGPAIDAAGNVVGMIEASAGASPR